MLHEPKFWTLIFFLGELLGGGMALAFTTYRKIGIASIVMALAGLAAMFLFWPEA